MKKVIRIIAKNIIFIICGAVLGLLALLLVHLLPVEPMQENVYWSMEMIEKEFTDEVLIDGYRSTLTGNFTDCLMLEHAVYKNSEHNVLQQALRMYRAESFDGVGYEDGWWPGRSLKDYLEGTPQPREVEYARYWHGYLVVLKPILMLTSVNSIRLINSSLQLLLVGMVIILLCQRNAVSLSKAFLVSMPFLFFVSSFSSFSLSICLYIMLFAMIVQLKWDTKIMEHNAYAAFFLIIGMLTSYFDFLTYPIITLGYPLCVYLFLHGKTFWDSIKKMFFYSIEWFVGYVGLWATKWVLADLLTGSTTIKDALSTVLTRTQSAENASRLGGFFSVLAKNIGVYTNWSFILIGVVVLFLLLMEIRKLGFKNMKANLSVAATLFILACYPLGWYFVTQNHSEQHWQFTCRILALSVFAGVAGMFRMIQRET